MSSKLSILDLLHEPIVENCVTEWKDAGLELQVPNWKLAEIEHNHPRDVSSCKREMLIFFLKYHENPTLVVVYQAIQTVLHRQMREKNRHDSDKEKIEVVRAFDRLDKFLDEFDSRNQKIESDIEEHVADMEKEKQWMNIDERKRSSFTQELEGEKETKRKIHSALRGNDLHRSSFSNNYISTKYKIEAHVLTDKEVEGYLRKALIEIEIKESRVIRGFYLAAKSHFERQCHLKKELDALKRILDDRLKAYAVIKMRLFKLGVKADAVNIKRLEKQIQCIKSTLGECTTLVNE